jgi:hypothetical protein
MSKRKEKEKEKKYIRAWKSPRNQRNEALKMVSPLRHDFQAIQEASDVLLFNFSFKEAIDTTIQMC